jgi:Uma2 family endonuclease
MYLLRQDPATLRKPDASVLLKATHPTVPETFISVRPDIAIEVISQNDRVANFEMKLLDYREAGIPLVWVIYPDLLFVRVYEGGSEIPRVLHIDDEIDGGPVLPQFKRPVRDLFSAEIIERAHRLKEDRRRTPTQE